MHLHRFAQPAAAEPPDAKRGVVLAQHDAVVAGQVLGGLRGAVSLQIARRCTQPTAVGGNLAGDQARVGQFTKADGHIDGIVRQRDRPVGQVQLHLHLREAFGKR